MTVGQLIDYLREFDGDLEVVVAYPSGDYWKTTLVKPLDRAEYCKIRHSAYHNCDKIVESEDLDDDTAPALVFK